MCEQLIYSECNCGRAFALSPSKDLFGAILYMTSHQVEIVLCMFVFNVEKMICKRNGAN